MNGVIIFCTIAAIAVILTDLIGWWLLKNSSEESKPALQEWPKVAILLAARNEAHNLPKCLQALEKINYPAESLSVWIGNDQSSDATPEIALSYCEGKNNWHLIDIKGSGGQVKGKANALAQLAKAASPFADYYCITDADVVVPIRWVESMVNSFWPGVGLVYGTTLIQGTGWFARMQRIDWVKGQALIKAFSYFPRIGKSVTAVGNNMVVQKKAYELVGGYENIPFSITEDFELHRQLDQRGYKSLQLSSPGTKARTLPVQSWAELFHQRKRWMKGAMQLPKSLMMILLLHALFSPVILVILWYSPVLGLALLLAKWMAQALLVKQLLNRINEPATVPWIGYELYYLILNIGQLIFYLLPVKVNWKGRRY